MLIMLFNDSCPEFKIEEDGKYKDMTERHTPLQNHQDIMKSLETGLVHILSLIP